ncbi:MAG TPA: hypothetical protein VNU71_04765 [Burkholderiaceae bacterium]|nr:hypothetical protein [Burkholderiaceae bacterium]
MRQAPRFPIRALAAAAMFALAAPVLAQSSNAILRGSVAATGQAAAGAEIVATNTATGLVVRTRSNADGSYALGVRLDVINLFDYKNYADYSVDWSKHVATANTAGNLDGPPRTVKVGLNASW